MTATVFRKGVFLQERGCLSVLGHTQISHSQAAVSGAGHGLALPGVHEKKCEEGGRQVQNIKDLIATLTSIRSKESLLGSLIS